MKPISLSKHAHLKDVCLVRGVLDRIGDQLSLLVLDLPGDRTLHFNELLCESGDISRQMLSRTLKVLEEDGFAIRTLYSKVPRGCNIA
ncbi:winged helix-turn-helix transcriptional regulator [Falsirhodobacter sp. 1013]|uniref:winged helix-turn-helix transcriptional regulator n=1 Tax=Falsirhodobacter sp. 1013 TaxID=3417566 RepID=UPI003EB9F66A